MGLITAVEAAQGTLRIRGIAARVEPDARIEDPDGTAIPLSAVSIGDYAKARGAYRNGAIRVASLDLLRPGPGAEWKVELTGSITRIDRGASSFDLMGIEVRVSPRTVIEMK